MYFNKLENFSFKCQIKLMKITQYMGIIENIMVKTTCVYMNYLYIMMMCCLLYDDVLLLFLLNLLTV